MSNRESDLDIAVLVDGSEDVSKDKYQWYLGGEFIRLFMRDDVDVVIINTANSLLRYEIAMNCKIIFEKGDAFAKFASRAMKDYEDDKKFYDQFYKDAIHSLFDFEGVQ